MSETIQVGERRALLVDGANPTPDAVITVSSDGLVSIDPADADGVVIVTALVESPTFDITVTEGDRTGTDSGIVIGPAAVPPTPLAVTLGDPLP